MFKKNKKKELEQPPTKEQANPSDIQKQIKQLEQQLKQREKEQANEIVKPQVKVSNQEPEELPKFEEDPIRLHIIKTYGDNYLYGLLAEQIITNELLRKFIPEE